MSTTKNPGRLSRREFCGVAVGGTLGAAVAAQTVFGANAPAPAPSSEAPKATAATAGSPVVSIVRDPKVWTGEGIKTDPARLRALVDRAVCLALGKENPAEAWKSIIKPSDVVGLKINCLGGAAIATRPDIVETVIRCVLDAGVPEGNIIVWDRGEKDLDKGGFPVQTEPGKVRYLGAPPMNEKEFDLGGVKTHLSNLVMETCTAIVSLPVLKPHRIAGFTGALKNWMGAMSNAKDIHPDACIKVADLNALAPLRDKTRIFIMDALRPLYEGGPGDNPAARWQYHGMLAATDPVAMDFVARSILEEKRREVKGEAWPIEAPSLQRAAELGLGVGDLKKIRVVKQDIA